MLNQLFTLSSTKQTTNVMKITRRVDTATKYLQSPNLLDHTINCTVCENRQDFDNQSKKEAKKAVVEAGWREGTNEDKEAFCLCPECVEDLGSTADREDKLNEIQYD